MLNEFLELEAYVTEPKSDVPRIQPYLLTDSFGDSKELDGLEQILTTIARGFIFLDNKRTLYAEDGLINEKLLVDTIWILQRWCGFGNSEVQESEDSSIGKWIRQYPDADGWLREYWKYHFNKGGKKKGTKKTCEALWKDVAKKWDKRLNEEWDYRAKSINFKNVIANALEMGPLQKRYFVFRKDLKKIPVKEKATFDYLYEVAEGKSKPNINKKMKFLKNIAAYLALLEYYPKGQKEVLLERGQLLGWYGQDDAKGDNSIWYFDNLLWRGKPIFIRNWHVKLRVKFLVNPEFLEEFDFRLIEESEIEDYKAFDDYWILEDCGHGYKDCWHIK